MDFELTRRGLMLAGAALSMTATRSGYARSDTPVSFQLSWIKSIQYGGYFAGIDQSIYQRFGIHPTFNAGGPSMDAIANVAAGRSQLGDRPVGAIIIARDNGIPVKVIGTVFQKSPYCIISLASRPLKSVADFIGKTIAVPTSLRPLMLYLLRSNGIGMNDVNIVFAPPDPSALVSGQIDGYAGYSTNQGVMLQTRGINIHTLNVQDLGIPEFVGTIYGREDFLNANRDLVVRFLRASIEGWKWAFAHPQETAQMMVEKYGAPGLDFKAQLAEIGASRPYIEAGVGTTKGLLALDLPMFADVLRLYKAVGLIKTPIRVEEFCDASFVDAARAPEL